MGQKEVEPTVIFVMYSGIQKRTAPKVSKLLKLSAFFISCLPSAFGFALVLV